MSKLNVSVYFIEKKNPAHYREIDTCKIQEGFLLVGNDMENLDCWNCSEVKFFKIAYVKDDV